MNQFLLYAVATPGLIALLMILVLSLGEINPLSRTYPPILEQIHAQEEARRAAEEDAR